jgi:excisionase family DNA binding protein
MPQQIKKFIIYANNFNENFIRGVWEYPEPKLYRYAYEGATKEMKLPKGAEFDFDASIWERYELFDEKNEMKISELAGHLGVIYIRLEAGKYLESIYVEPDAVAVDLFRFDDKLIYEFYNPSKHETVTIRAKQADDKEEIFQKIKGHGDDLEFRQYILRQALIKPGICKLDKPKTEYPEWLSVKQVAEILNISEQAVYMRAHRGKLIKHYVGGALRFKKSELDL